MNAPPSSKRLRPAAPPPSAGIISKTVIKSPVARWLLPARFCRKVQHDIAFIGETFVEIKQITRDGRLRHLGTKTGFSSRIRSAGVIGEAAKPLPDPPYSTSPADEAVGPADMPPQFLVLACDEPPELRFLVADSQGEGFSNIQSLRFHERIEPLPTDSDFLAQPGNILAIDPGSRAIAVAAVKKNLIVYRLKDMSSLSEEYANNTTAWNPVAEGCVLKIDGYVRQMEFLRAGVPDRGLLVLVLVVTKEKRSRLWWYIWNLDQGPLCKKEPFTCPLAKDYRDPQLLIPLQHLPSFLLIYGQHYLVVDGALDGALTMTNPIQFLPEASNFIEAPRFPDVSSDLSVWTAWSPDVHVDEWNHTQEERFYVAREDGKVFYFHMEDGRCNYQGRMCDFLGSLGKAFAVCESSMDLQSPFFLVSGGNMTPGCVMSVDPTEPRSTAIETMRPRPIERIQNWSPSTDMIVSGLINSNVGLEAGQRQAIYATASRGPDHGAIAELNFGLQATLAKHFDFEADVNGFWAVHDGARNIFLVLSYVSDTQILRLRDESLSSEESLVALDEENCDAKFDKTTITAAIVTSGQLIQVTNSSIHLLSCDGETLKGALASSFIHEGDGEILYAAVWSPSSSVILALRVNNRCLLQLVHVSVGETAASIEPQIRRGIGFELSSEPTAVAIFSTGTTMWVATTASGILQILRCGNENELTHTVACPMGASALAECNSIAVLQDAQSTVSSTSNITRLILCGMTDGSVLVFEVVVHLENMQEGGNTEIKREDHHKFPTLDQIRVEFYRTFRFGVTAVALVPTNWDQPSTCFLHCGSAKCLLDYDITSSDKVNIKEIFSNWRIYPASHKEQIQAVSPLMTAPKSANVLTNTLAILQNKTFMLTELDYELKPVPSLLGVQGTPNRVLFSEQLSVLVVASQITKFVPEQGPKVINEQRGMRKVFAQIEFLSTTDRLTKPADDGRSTERLDDGRKPVSLGTFKFWPQEKIYAMTEIIFKNKEKRYICLFVGSGIRQTSGHETGYLTVLGLRSNGNEIGIQVLKRSNFREPIYSIAQAGKHEIAFAAGKTLHLFWLNMNTRTGLRWSDLGTRELRSAGLHITATAGRSTTEKLISVSTAEDSLVSFALSEINDAEAGTTKLSFSQRPVLTDSEARESIHHLCLSLPFDQTHKSPASQGPESIATSSRTVQGEDFPSDYSNVILISDKSDKVTGLFDTRSTNSTAAATLFEARLPQSVMRLRQGNIRPLWRRAPSKPLGVLAEDIVGITVEGAVYQFSIVDGNASRLLMIIEDLLRLQEARRLERCGRRGIPYRAKWPRPQVGADDNFGFLAGSRRSGLEDHSRFHFDGDLFKSLISDDVDAMAALRSLLTLMGEDVYVGPDRPTFEGIAREALCLDDTVQDSELELKLLEWLRAILTSVL